MNTFINRYRKTAKEPVMLSFEEPAVHDEAEPCLAAIDPVTDVLGLASPRFAAKHPFVFVGEQVRFEDWRLLKSDFLVIGAVAPEASGLAVEFELFNVQTGQQLLTKRLVTSERGLRATAHRIADLIFERLTGIPGAFSTRIAYVSVDGRPPSQFNGVPVNPNKYL